MDWFPFDNGLRHERVNFSKSFSLPWYSSGYLTKGFSGLTNTKYRTFPLPKYFQTSGVG